LYLYGDEIVKREPWFESVQSEGGRSDQHCELRPFGEQSSMR
jgi:hypothetical protein